MDLGVGMVLHLIWGMFPQICQEGIHLCSVASSFLEQQNTEENVK